MASGSPGEPTEFIARWSARKEAARRGENRDPETTEVPSEIAPAEPEWQPTDADMPPLETLTEESDYSGFLSPKVSEALRQAALSRLFRSPSLNLTDGLDDYAEDFTQFAPLGEVLTADLRHRLEQAARRLLEEGDAPRPLAPEPEAVEAQAAIGTTPEPEDSPRTEPEEMA